MGEGHGGAARTAGQQALADRQALPGLGVAQAVRRQAYVAGNQLRIEAGPGLLPATALVQGGGDRQQFDALFDQGGVGVRYQLSVPISTPRRPAGVSSTCRRSPRPLLR